MLTMRSGARLLVPMSLLAVTPVAVAAPPTKAECQKAMKLTKEKSPATKPYFNKAYAYAVFPSVGRGAFGVGGAYGEGVVFRRGKMVARTTMAQVSIGLGLGGENYIEVIFFKNKRAFDRFVEGSLEFGARATAAAADNAASKDMDYNNGVAIFTVTKAGLIADAAVGGQKFTYEKL